MYTASENASVILLYTPTLQVEAPARPYCVSGNISRQVMGFSLSATGLGFEIKC